MSFGVVLSVVAVCGVAVGVVTSLAWAAAVGLAVAGVSVGVASAGRNRRSAQMGFWGMVAALAMAYGAHAREEALHPGLGPLLAGDGSVLVAGRLRRDAAITESGVRLELDDVRVSGAGGTSLGARVRVLATVGGEVAHGRIRDWTAGRRLAMPARFRAPAYVRNPGAPSLRWQHLTRPFDAVGTVKSALLVTVTPASRWQEAAAAVRAYVRAVCLRWLAPLGAQSAAVTAAVLIGDRAGLDAAAMRRLQVAGTFHVIAISGGNVAILTVLCLSLLRLFTTGGRAAVTITLVAVVAYGFIVGRDASVMRAVVAAVLYLGLRLAGVVPNPMNVLALTGLVCVAIDPLIVIDVGAWLSFGATLGLIAILPRLSGDGRTSNRPGTRQQRWRAVRGLLLATVAAEIVILPVSATTFMRVGLAGVVLNLIAIPAMTLVQVSGLALCALAPLGPWCGGLLRIVAALGHVATSMLLGSAGLVDLVPWLVWRVPPPPGLWVVAYYAAVLLALTWSGRRAVGRGAAIVAMLCAASTVAAPWTRWAMPPRGWTRITVIDVGQGEAIAVQMPGARTLLVDAGGSPGSFDIGGRIVTPALWASGIRRVDWLAVTHADADHAGGAVRVTEDLRPREIWEGIPVPGDPVLTDLQARAGRARIAWRRVRAGDHLAFGGVSIDVMHPPAPDWERRKVRNDDSVVLRLRMGLVEVLLTGDAGPEFEAAFEAEESRPPIRILKVGHHGSATSTSEAFLDAYRPALAVVSAGQGNLFGHPARPVLDRLARRDIGVLRTDRDGAIVIETNGRVARVRTASGRSVTVTAGATSPAATRLPFRPS